MLNKGFPKDKSKSIVVLGFFDGIHRGHRAVLNQASRISQRKEKPLRIVTFYPHPRNYVNHRRHIRYITTYSEKYRLLQTFYPDCEVFFLRFNRQLRHTTSQGFLDLIIQYFHPLAVLVGENFRFGYRTLGNCQSLKFYLQRKGIEVKIVPSVTLNGDVISSTMIRHWIEKGDLEKANAALGYQYMFHGRIVQGKQIGSRIGFPTANLYPVSSKMLPPYGVFFGSIGYQTVDYPALVYIGTKPTVSTHQRTVVEVHVGHRILRPLYQERVEVRLTHFWRPEKLFPSIEALKEQITIDQTAFNAYLQHTQGVINYPSNVYKLEV